MVGLHESLGELTGNIPARVSDALWKWSSNTGDRGD